MSEFLISVGDNLLRVGFAATGAWMGLQAGKSLAEFKDVQAAVQLGVGVLLMAMAVKSI